MYHECLLDVMTVPVQCKHIVKPTATAACSVYVERKLFFKSPVFSYYNLDKIKKCVNGDTFLVSEL